MRRLPGGGNQVWLLATFCACFLLTSAAPTEGDVRLVRGPNPYEGRVEYFHDGVWLSLCRSYTYYDDFPKVVCRQLGYQAEGAMMFYAGSYGAAPGEVYRGMISCSGNEVSLRQCTITPQEVNCDPNRAIGISCNTNITVPSTIRLSAGSTRYEGRLEIFQNGVWGTVCRGYSSVYIYHTINAHVACKQLFGTGYGGSYFPDYETASRFGLLLSGAILKSYATCNGDENSIFNCLASEPSNECDHEDDLTLSCFPVPSGCGGSFISDAGTIQSPGYPGGHSYANETDCVWKITASPYKLIRLSFTDFQPDPSQTSNYLSVIDYYGYSPISYLQSAPASDVVFTGNVMYVRLHTAAGSTGIKFGASWRAFYQCDQNFTSTSTSILSTGYYGPYPADMDCTYYIIQRPEFRVLLQFHAFVLDDAVGGSCMDFITIYDGESESAPVLGGPFCGSTIPPTLTSTQNVVMIKFHSDGNTSSTAVGFYISYTGLERVCNQTFTSTSASILSTGYNGPYAADMDCTYYIIQRPEFTVRLQFLAFGLDDAVGGSCMDFITIYDGDSESAPILGGPFCGSTISPTLTSTQNVVMIKFHSDGNTSSAAVGFHIYYTGLEPDPIVTQLTGNSGSFESPGFPNIYDNDTDYIWNITAPEPYQVVVVTFSDFTIGQCYSSYLMMRDHYEYGSYLATPCGSGLPTPVTSSGQIMYVRLVSTPLPTTDSGSRFKVSWKTECRQTFSGTGGTVVSPKSPSTYPPNLDCIILINQNLGYIVMLNFTSFRLDAAVNGVCGDYVEVRDGSSEYSPLIGKYCGTSLPPPFFTKHISMWIRFRSDNGTDATSVGFTATYQGLEKECEGQLMTAPAGNFTSPGFPVGYPRDAYCIWTITVNPGDVIELTFNQFSMDTCSYAYVRIYESNIVDADTVITTLCGVSAVPKITTRANSLTVVLNSFGYSAGTGFHASYISINEEKADVSQYNLFPYGFANGDARAQLTETSMQKIVTPSQFPFGRDQQDTVYIGNNGIVSIGNAHSWPILPEDQMVVCAYCAYIDNTDNFGGIFYRVYGRSPSDRTVLKKATREVREFTESPRFTASLVLVVTWEKVKQGQYSNVLYQPKTEDGEATFQLVLASDGVTSYVLVYYLTGAMNWLYRGQWSYVIMGYSDGTGDDYQFNLYSKTKIAYSIDDVLGNAGRKGIWIYKVGEVLAQPERVCMKWFFRNLIHEEVDDRFRGFAELPRCPCSGRDVWRKTRYMWTWCRTDPTRKFQCYRLNMANSQSVYPYGKECCYSTDETDQLTYEQLIMDPPYAGSALAYNPAIFALREQYELEDRQGHDACCTRSSNPLSCLLYYILRPIGECRADIPFRFSWLWGDPHIMTLDEREYIFNGWGEYTLVTVNALKVAFTLQGRMGCLELENGKEVNATVFTAFGAEENRARMFVGLHPVTRNSLEIYVNDIDYSRRFYDEGDDFLVDTDNFTIFRDNSSFVISFPSGITMAVAVRVRSLIFSIFVPTEFKSLTRGLLGNYNGAKDDDFVLPNGTVLSDTMSDREIHHQFGQMWAVTEGKSILRYGTREGPANYAHRDFEPIFLDEVSATDRRAAESVCGTTDEACIYDYIVTGSERFALDTKTVKEQAMRENAQIKNTLPELEVPANVSVTPGQTVSFRVLAKDPDAGDKVTYKLADDASGALSINSSTGEVTANLNIQQPAEIRVYAVDSYNGQSVIRTIPIVVCSKCNGHGSCDVTKTREEVGTLYFRYAVCVCQSGWTGEDCDLDYDVCEDNPCDPLQNCIDLTPAQQATSNAGYTCGGCPAGYSLSSGGSAKCLDVDECTSSSLNNCGMGCENTEGSYQCTCNAGYWLSSDGHSCLDVNECAEKTDNCDQICKNTPGNFQCLCEEGFTYDSIKKVCNENQATKDACQNSGCSQGCRAVTNPSTNTPVPECFCRPGYDLDPHGVTCTDHDECKDGICAQACNNTEGSFSCSCYSGYQLNDDQRTCSTCPSLTYGPECSMNCSCSGRGLACDPVTGCICRAGWTGSECKDDVNECEENPDVCGKGMMCSNNKGSYTCTCRPGYEMNEDGICKDLNECSTGGACAEFQTCTNIPSSFYCTCLPGYQEHNDTCIDINECSTRNGGCQQLCVNKGGSYNCECYYGYTLNADRSTCTEVSDPCDSGNLCDHGCTLDDTDREICFCSAGYTLQADGRTCQDIDECAEGMNVCSNSCNNTDGGFTCSCPPGMTLGNDKATCEDCPTGTYGNTCSRICDCGLGADRCDVITGCVCKAGWRGEKCADDVNECQTEAGLQKCQAKNAECFNFQGGYQCRCRAGFVFDADGNCQDVDECARSPCGQQCENTMGSYRCLCRKGFSMHSESGECIDIDECRLFSTNLCKQKCHNIPGSYRCSCDVPGYVLANDGFSCTAERSCSRTDCNTTNGGCKSENGQESCFCNSGYTLQADKVSCVFDKVGWCDDSVKVCDEQCQLSGDLMTFTCSCGQGHLLNDDGRTCRVCREGTYGVNCTSNCACNIYNTKSCDPVKGTCTCRPGWQGNTCDDDRNECSLMSSVCDEHEVCRNTIGNFTCVCGAGYVRNENGSCTGCTPGTYGMDCNQTCNCPGENVESCDKVDGTCRCKAGWEGASCDGDIDECELGRHSCSADDHLDCENTDGSFSCVCMQNYHKNSNGKCVATKALKFRITIFIIFNGDLNETTHAYQLLKTEATNTLSIRLSGRVPGLLAIVVSSIRRGSVILEAGAVVANSSASSSAAALSSVLVDMNGENMTLSNQTGPIGVDVGYVTVNTRTTKCDVFLQFGGCNGEETCEVVDGAPSCSSKETGGESTQTWLIIGLAVGIPVAIVAVCFVAFCCYKHRSKNTTKVMHYQDRNGSSSQEDAPDYNQPPHRAGLSDKKR